MNLLRYRPIKRTVKVNGRRVEVRISENQIVQEVEDNDVQHATARPLTIGVTQKFQPDLDTGIWVPFEKER